MRSLAPLALAFLAASACSPGAEKNDEHGTLNDGGIGSDGGIDPGGGFDPNPDFDKCGTSPHTSVSGVVYSPAKSGADPIYNVIVFVPKGPLRAFEDGVSCDKCGKLASADAMVSTLSAPDGSFKLTGVPAGENVTVVFQVGRWRRSIVVPTVARCTDTKLAPSQTRLPRNKKEGDIPKMAIATGSADPTECLLRKIGIDDSEFTVPSGGGRVHLYKSDGADLGASTPPASELYASAANLKSYDVVLLPCEGLVPPLKTKPPGPKGDAATNALLDYTNAGGRVFATHYSHVWFSAGPATWPSVAKWSGATTAVPGTLAGTVDTSFPKGKALSQWLVHVGASTTPGEIPIVDWRHNVDGPTAPSQRWIYSKSPETLQHFTFNTPYGAPAEKLCGRVVFSNFHITKPATSSTFPASCGSDTALDPQEKMLEFMLFDIASCVEDDRDAPKPPR